MNKYARPYSFPDLNRYLNTFLDLFHSSAPSSASEDGARVSTDRVSWARSSAWLEHWSYTPSVGGSNPPVPIRGFVREKRGTA